MKNIIRIISPLKKGYNLLLLTLLFVFVFHPFTGNVIQLAGWKLLITAAIIFTLFNHPQAKILKVIEVVLGIIIAGFSFLILLDPQKIFIIIASSSNTLFTLIFLWVIIYDVLLKKTISAYVLEGAVCAYLLIGIAFGHFFTFMAYMYPGSFIFPYQHAFFTYPELVSEMIYFSFGNLVTVSYGDVVPSLMGTQKGAILEALLGHLYIAIFISRLVAMHTSREKS